MTSEVAVKQKRAQGLSKANCTAHKAAFKYAVMVYGPCKPVLHADAGHQLGTGMLMSQSKVS